MLKKLTHFPGCVKFSFYFSSCYGIRRPAGQWLIVSAGLACGEQNKRALYTRVAPQNSPPMQPSGPGHFLKLLEALPVIVNKLLELREQCFVPRREQVLEPALGA
jgi:hypothetical protein